MSVNVLDNITSYFTPDIIEKASSFLGENPASTSKAVRGIVPSVLDRLVNLVSAPGGEGQLENLVNKAGADGGIVNNVSGLFSGGNTTTSAMGVGRDLLGSLFAGNTNSVASAVSNFSGISSNSARSLMALVAPLVLGALAKLRYAQTMTTGALANMLSGQRASIAAAVPSTLSTVAPAYATATTAAAFAPAASTDVQGLRHVTVTREAERPRAMNWMWLLIPLLAVLFYFGLRGRGSPPARTAAVPAVNPAREGVRLCNGQSVPLTRDSFNYNLGNFLVTGSNAELPKTFVFDNLNFDSATTTLTPESRATVNDLVTILNACPSAQVKLVGHTDSTGDTAANVTLSQNRANVVKDMLVSGGVAGDRVSTAGYGQEKPVASNDTEEGKARNRRTELIVVQR
jgi:OmpA-OmpF porin, OOP family